MKKRLLLVALTGLMAIAAMNAQHSYRNQQVGLEDLAGYIDTTRGVDPATMMFYVNLINNPTHSYRIEHFDVGFNGCTGRVDEHVVMADGSQRDNVFVFNDQGLLTQSTIQGSKGKKTVTDYTYSYDDVMGFTLQQSKSKTVKINYAPIYGEHGHRVAIKADNGSRQDFTYNELGHLSKLVITPAKGEKRTLMYQGGYVVREETGGRVFRYHYEVDTATGKKYLIAIKELKDNDVIHERTFDFSIDTHGRYSRVSISLDGKPQMTITRTYSR